MSGSHPRAGGPRRRSFTAEQKLAHVTAYEQALHEGKGGAYLSAPKDERRDKR